MRLILTEKPSVAAEFARALKAEKHQGYYENTDTIITYCIGHLLRLYNPEEYSPEYREWKIETLPIVPEHYHYAEIPEQKRQLVIIKFLFTKLNGSPFHIIIATDAGREGEVIARETLAWCGKTDLSNVYRFWTSEALTDESIQRNLRELKPADNYTRLYLSGYYRMLSDWLVGMNFSRFFTVKLNSLFSFGRVQIPVLSVLVERTDSIKNFTSKAFYNLRVTLARDSTMFFAFHIEDGNIRFDSKETLESILLQIQQLRPSAHAVRTQKEQKVQNPPQLYNLTALQKDANKYFGYKAFQTAEIAQGLYEQHKVLSYPRTSSRVLSQSSHKLFCSLITNLNFHYPDFFRGCTLPAIDNTNIFDDSKLSDHHALLILDKLPTTLSEEEINVANLVLKNMAALLLSPYIYNLQTVDFDICGNLFQSKGTQVLNQGWKQLYSANKSSDEENPPPDDEESFDKALPPITEGDLFDVLHEELIEKKTKPPSPFTEAALLGLMERNGLGTEATRADIIEKLFLREYAFRAKRNIVSTDKGSFLIRTVQSLPAKDVTDFISVSETAKWEALLESSPDDFYTSIKLSLQDSITSLRSLELAKYEKPPIGNCPHCSSPLRDAHYSYLCTSTTDCHFAIPKIIAGHTLTQKELSQLLSGAETHLSKFKSEKTGSFKAKLRYDPTLKKLSFIYPNHFPAGGTK